MEQPTRVSVTADGGEMNGNIVVIDTGNPNNIAIVQAAPGAITNIAIAQAAPGVTGPVTAIVETKELPNDTNNRNNTAETATQSGETRVVPAAQGLGSPTSRGSRGSRGGPGSRGGRAVRGAIGARGGRRLLPGGVRGKQRARSVLLGAPMITKRIAHRGKGRAQGRGPAMGYGQGMVQGMGYHQGGTAGTSQGFSFGGQGIVEDTMYGGQQEMFREPSCEGGQDMTQWMEWGGGSIGLQSGGSEGRPVPAHFESRTAETEQASNNPWPVNGVQGEFTQRVGMMWAPSESFNALPDIANPVAYYPQEPPASTSDGPIFSFHSNPPNYLQIPKNPQNSAAIADSVIYLANADCMYLSSSRAAYTNLLEVSRQFHPNHLPHTPYLNNYTSEVSGQFQPNHLPYTPFLNNFPSAGNGQSVNAVASTSNAPSWPPNNNVYIHNEIIQNNLAVARNDNPSPYYPNGSFYLGSGAPLLSSQQGPITVQSNNGDTINVRNPYYPNTYNPNGPSLGSGVPQLALQQNIRVLPMWTFEDRHPSKEEEKELQKIMDKQEAHRAMLEKRKEKITLDLSIPPSSECVPAQGEETRKQQEMKVDDERKRERRKVHFSIPKEGPVTQCTGNKEGPVNQRAGDKEGAAAQHTTDKEGLVAQCTGDMKTLMAQYIADKGGLVAQCTGDMEVLVAHYTDDKGEPVTQYTGEKEEPAEQCTDDKEKPVVQQTDDDGNSSQNLQDLWDVDGGEQYINYLKTVMRVALEDAEQQRNIRGHNNDDPQSSTKSAVPGCEHRVKEGELCPDVISDINGKRWWKGERKTLAGGVTGRVDDKMQRKIRMASLRATEHEVLRGFTVCSLNHRIHTRVIEDIPYFEPVEHTFGHGLEFSDGSTDGA